MPTELQKRSDVDTRIDAECPGETRPGVDGINTRSGHRVPYGSGLLIRGHTITRMRDDDATQEAPAGAAPPTSDLGPAPGHGHQLAYSDHTTSLPVIDYEVSRSMRPGWIMALVLLAAGAVAAATFVLGRTTATEQAAEAGVPPTASASPVPRIAPADDLADVKFRAALDTNGLPLAEPIVAMGRPVCDHLRSGDTLDRAAERVMDDLQWSWEWAHYFTTSAVGAYCPEFDWATKTAVNLPPLPIRTPIPATAGPQPGDSCPELHAVTQDAGGQKMWCNPLMTGDHSLHWMYGGPS